MAVDYTPIMGEYKELKPFRYWCQKVLPLVYDDSLSYYELLCKVVDYLNKTMEDVDTLHEDVDDLHDAYVQLQTYVNNYFDNLDVQTEINNKLDAMVTDGTFAQILSPLIEDYQDELDVLESRIDTLESNYTPGSTTADAELIDIRVGYDGTEYDTAGDAVRGQVENLEDDVAHLNSLSGLSWYNGYYQSSNNQFVGTADWKMSTAYPCEGGDSITYCGVSSQTNRWVFVFWNSLGQILSGLNNFGTDYEEHTITVPSGAEYFRVLAKTDGLDNTYIIYGANANQHTPIANRRRILALERESKINRTVYVDGSAVSNGTGTKESPFNNLQSVIDAGYYDIKAKAGLYQINGLFVTAPKFNISLWSNITEFDSNVPSREKIVLIRGDQVEYTRADDQITASYTPRANSRFVKVFVTGELTPIDSSFVYAEAYNVDVFLWKAGHKARRYKPVLYTDFTGAVGTFTYNNGNIILIPFDTDADNDLELYVSADPGRVLSVNECVEASISDVVTLGGWFANIELKGCQKTIIKDCELVCASHGDGISALDSNVTIQNCLASGNAQDGYGFQFYGESLMENCSAFYSGDDGVSHHRGCIGYIDGGEFSHNVSGGITPAFGADVNISNVVAMYNDYGLQFLGTENAPSRDLLVNSCVAKNNTTKDIYNSGYDVRFVNCVYDTQQATTGNTNTFFG